MKELEELKLKIGNFCWEFWCLLPEPKLSYTKYYQGIERVLDQALENWHLSDREKRIAAKEGGDVGV